MRRIALLTALFPVVASLAACNSAVPGDATSDSSEGSSSTPAAVPSSSAAPVTAARTIEVAAENWSFSPSTIRVKKGEKVTVKLASAEGIHGFASPELNINQRVDAGQTINVTIPTDTPGTYEFFCSIPCGEGHKDMRGTIVIE